MAASRARDRRTAEHLVADAEPAAVQHDPDPTRTWPRRRRDARPGNLSRRRLCRDGAVALLGLSLVPVTSLLAACSGGGDADDGASGDGAPGGAGGGDELGGEDGQPVMYSSPTCGCCAQYATYLEDNGHPVEVRHVDDLPAIKRRAGVPAEAESCHTTMIDGYAVEGHVPVEAVDQLLRDRPDVEGIALPGMPGGSPGMSGTKTAPFEILSFKSGAVEPYTAV
jgi:hypothetical protein